MIIIDTSIWADHFRREEPQIGLLLIDGNLKHHPLVTAELGMGNLRDWRRTIILLSRLPQAVHLTNDALLDFVEEMELAGTGIGAIDAHLLGSAHVSGCSLWTRDRRLLAQAERLGLAFRL
ncbi:PIN domain-containing protein [Novosphingobium sp.]|uniref:type II toxin-antitoxin system VapC family toxin n=1 Tax=Novosphingobium sp. TaxID=1874826 RepID=UPI00333EFC61